MEELNNIQTEELDKLQEQDPELSKTYDEASKKVYSKRGLVWILLLVLILIAFGTYLEYFHVPAEETYFQGFINGTEYLIKYQTDKGVVLFLNNGVVEELDLMNITQNYYNLGLQECGK